jgi:hypothetical protein
MNNILMSTIKNDYDNNNELFSKIMKEFESKTNIHFYVYTYDLKLYGIVKYNNEIYYFDEDKAENIENLKIFNIEFFSSLKIPYISIHYESNEKATKFLNFTDKYEHFYGDVNNVPSFN